MCYDFDFLSAHYPDGEQVGRVLEKFQRIVTEGWACWAYSNHDVVRHPTRWGVDEPALRAYGALLLSIQGSVCLYQGEELGLAEAYVAYEDLHDPYGKRFWPKFKGRDGARTPMPWIEDHSHGGFSDARPWLPMAVEHLSRAVAVQERDPDSTLAFFRAMLAFRRATPALVKGAMEIASRDAGHIALIRRHEGQAVWCGFNLSAEERHLPLPPGEWRQQRGAPFAARLEDGAACLPPWQVAYAAREEP
jgi:alpha-glucosidase